ncbi:MAG: ferritin-like domain-containing protein [Planctomycetes bacterium]|nr:ferritin-like domain-containing protein [Planctomycetota bacterium]
MAKPRIGSEDHKRLFCGSFTRTHDPFKPEDIPFPAIDEESRQRLLSLPIWDEAVNTERETAAKVSHMATIETDPLMSEAIALQGFEEGRHAKLLDRLTSAYGIPVKRRADEPPPANPAWEFTRTEYGECFDAFFAFGLFSFAKDSGFFPEPLVKAFDPIMQEEARHVLFFVNWMAYKRAQTSLVTRPLLDFKRALAVSLQILSRIRTAFDLGGGNEQDNFAMTGHKAIGEFSIRAFLETCLRENSRRLGLYEAELLRPSFVPTLARLALKVTPS